MKAETLPLAHDAVRLGTVVELDLATATARVDIAGEGEDTQTGWLTWGIGRAGETKVWLPPSVGEQVIVLCPDGDLESGVIIASLFSDANAAPANSATASITFKDGATLSYNPATNILDVALPANGRVNIMAPAGLAITGDIALTGKLTASDDVIAAGKSLKSHKHTAVQAGAAISGPPQ